MGQVGGFVNFVCSALGLPFMWVKLALAGDARVLLLKRAVPLSWMAFEKKTLSGERLL